MQSKLFNKSSVEKISSPEKMNDYIQVANPSTWMILAAALILLAAVLIWGIFGSVSTTFSVSGLAKDGKIICYVSPGYGLSLQEGMQVAVSGDMKGTVTGSITGVSETPLSYTEASGSIDGDYQVYALNISDWNICAEITVDEPLTEGAIYNLSITTQSIRPIELVFN